MTSETVTLEVGIERGQLPSLKLTHSTNREIIQVEWYRRQPNGQWIDLTGRHLPEKWAEIPDALCRANGIFTSVAGVVA